ncbi:hypothetical protein BUE80_DR008463, partial [Diplocarpon rosae]
MRFSISVVIPVAIFVDTAFSNPVGCTWPCWPFSKDTFKTILCNDRKYLASDTKVCYEQAKSLYFQDTKKKPAATPKIRTFPKVVKTSLDGSLAVTPYITFPLVIYGPWGEYEEFGSDRCFLDLNGKLAGFFYISPNFTQPTTSQDVEAVPPFEACKEYVEGVNPDKQEEVSEQDDDMFKEGREAAELLD